MEHRTIFISFLTSVAMLSAAAGFATTEVKPPKDHPAAPGQILAAAANAVQNHYAMQQQQVPAGVTAAFKDAQAAVTPVTSVAASKLMIEAILNSSFGTKNLVLDGHDELYWLMLDKSQNTKIGGVSRPPLMFQQRGKRWFIKALLAKPVPINALHLGDEVVAIDDEPFDPMLALRTSGEPQTIKLKIKHSPWGASAPVSMPLYSGKIAALLLSATHDSRKVFEHGKKRHIGYLHLWADVNNGFLQELEIAANQFGSSCDYWILDLRDSISTQNSEFATLWAKPDASKDKAPPPAVILVNGATSGALEQLASNVKNQHKAVIIGTPTAGSYSAYTTQLFADDNWMLLLPPKEASHLPSIDPAIVIDEPLMYANGNDPLLDKALQQ